MKHPTFRGLLRLAAFLLGLALIVAFANTFCIKTDIYAALTMAEVSYYDPVPDAMVGNDDLDLQILWLDVLEKKGADFTSYDLLECFVNNCRYSPGEYA